VLGITVSAQAPRELSAGGAPNAPVVGDEVRAGRDRSD
jgi:hypothetical protein